MTVNRIVILRRSLALAGLLGLTLIGLLPLAGCQKSDSEKAGDKIEGAIEETGDAIQDMGDKIEDATDQ